VVIGLALGVALGRHASPVDLDLTADLRLGPAEHFGHQLRHRLGGGFAAVPALERDPGAPGQHVVDVQRTFVRGGVERLHGQVFVGAGERRAQLGSLGH